MSFLSRKPSRSDNRGGNAGRDDEYDDYDYAPDGYADSGDDRSPVEYFSPGGIKGRWADGRSPADRSAGDRGGSDRGTGDRGPAARGRAAYDGYEDGFDSGAYETGGYEGAGYNGSGYDAGYDRKPAEGRASGSYQRDGYAANGYGPSGNGPSGYGADGYGAEEYATGAFDLPEGANDERPTERTRRRRREREERGERTGILRLRRDRGEDIWPDDGISDEDYWASVASDRPLNGASSPLDDEPPQVPAAAWPGPVSDAGVAPGPGPGPGPGQGRGPAGSGPGRLGPAPGLAGDFQPGGGSTGGSGSGPMSARPGTGPTQTIGATASRPAGMSGQGTWPGAGQPGGPSPSGPGPGSFSPPQPSSRPSFQPNGFTQGGAPVGARQQPDRGDWGERTERIERVTETRAADPRQGRAPSGASYAPSGTYGPARTSGPTAAHGAPAPLPGGPGPARGRSDADWRTPERRPASRDLNAGSGSRSAPDRGAAPARAKTDEDPLTSPAYSRAALRETDGRSYQVAARRSAAQTKLSDADTPLYAATGGYPTGQYAAHQPAAHQPAAHQPAGRQPAARQPTGRQSSAGQSAAGQPGNGHYPAAQSGQHRADPANQAGRYPSYTAHQDHSPVDRATGAADHGRPAPSARGTGRVSLPGGSAQSAGTGQSTGAYETQQPRPPQRPQPQQQPRQATARTAAPGMPGTSNGANGSAGSSGSPARAAGSMAGGLNPYDAAVTGSYPYPTQPYAGRSTTEAQPPEGADDRYYRPAEPPSPAASPARPAGDGQANGADYRRNGTGTGGYGSNGYGVPRDSRY
jgi:hypothetical protein